MAKREITPQMSKAARALLEMSQDDMAQKIGVSPSTIRRFEAGAAMSPENTAKLIAALKASGITPIYREGSVVGLVERGPMNGLIFDK